MDLETENHHFAAGIGNMIVHNSMYGGFGVRRGFLPFMPVAMTTTMSGRKSLLKAVDILENRYKASVIYGDSVTPDTPILCRLNGKIFYRTIDNLPSNEDWFSMLNKECRRPIEGLEVWSDTGFTKLYNIIRHATNKKIYRVLTKASRVCVTEDHSLLSDDGKEVKPTELRVGSKILLKELYHYPLQLNLLPSVQLAVDYYNNRPSDSNVITEITEIPNTFDYVYDLTTENHHFAAGVGRIIVHNTDSTFIKLPGLSDSKEIFKKAKEIEKEMSKEFPPPTKLEFEGYLYKKFLIFTKKRYAALLCDENGVILDKMKQRGILTTRRDHSKFVQDGFTQMLKMVLYDNEPKEVMLEYIFNRLIQLYSGIRFDSGSKEQEFKSFHYKDFIISKVVNDYNAYKSRPLNKDLEKRKLQLLKAKCKDEHEYAIKSLPAHVQLALRLNKRGQPVEPGTRLEYLITKQGGFYGKLFQKIEDPGYFLNHKDLIGVDFNYYCKAMINPYDEFLTVVYKVEDYVKTLHKRFLAKSECIAQLKKVFRNKVVVVNDKIIS